MKEIVRRERIVRRRCTGRKVPERELLEDGDGVAKDGLGVLDDERWIGREMRVDRADDRRIFAELLHEGLQVVVVGTMGEEGADEEVEEKVAVHFQAQVGRDRMLLLARAEENA